MDLLRAPYLDCTEAYWCLISACLNSAPTLVLLDSVNIRQFRVYTSYRVVINRIKRVNMSDWQAILKPGRDLDSAFMQNINVLGDLHVVTVAFLLTVSGFSQAMRSGASIYKSGRGTFTLVLIAH
jgi:hypothetical protein